MKSTTPEPPRRQLSGWCATNNCKPSETSRGCRMDGCECKCHDNTERK